MSMNAISSRLHAAFAVAALCASALLPGCQSDESVHLRLAQEIGFGARVTTTQSVRTRALDTLYVTSDPFNCNFYIELCGDMPDDEGIVRPVSKIGTYIVPPGYEGRLNAKPGDANATNENLLMWQDLTSDHTFYGWTLPWKDEEGTPMEEVFDTREPLPASIPVVFHDSPEGKDFQLWENNASLENFVGTVAGPYSYSGHGKYVELTFHHLVSKIYLRNFALIKTDGSVQRNLKATITFLGMPKQASFIPHPADAEGKPVRPHVTYDPNDQVADEGLTFFFCNDPTDKDYDPRKTYDLFYICPEIDFSTLGFKINLNDIDYGSYGDYYGDFSEVKFVRTPGTDYDQGGDTKILHAGEMMVLDMYLIPGTGPGISVVIQEWSTEKETESVHHSKPGIYTDGEAADVVGVFGNPNATQEQIDNLFELYGEKDENGDKLFHVYENVEINSSSFPVGKDYVLDGMGHSITMRSKSNASMFNGDPFVSVGPMRDVYLTDGEHTVWIDPDGKVRIFDETTGEWEVKGQLDALTGDNVGYHIDLVTGEVRQTPNV